jgi:hypothetical protein
MQIYQQFDLYHYPVIFIFTLKEKILMAVTDFFEAMKRKKNFTCGRGATDEDVKKIEMTLDVQLPNDYVLFLKIFGYVWWFGEAIYGFSEDPEYDVLSATLMARAERLPNLFHRFPDRALTLREYNGGYIVLYSLDGDRNGGVGWLESDELNSEVEHWATFEEYLRELIENKNDEEDDHDHVLIS